MICYILRTSFSCSPPRYGSLFAGRRHLYLVAEVDFPQVRFSLERSTSAAATLEAWNPYMISESVLKEGFSDLWVLGGVNISSFCRNGPVSRTASTNGLRRTCTARALGTSIILCGLLPFALLVHAEILDDSQHTRARGSEQNKNLKGGLEQVPNNLQRASWQLATEPRSLQVGSALGSNLNIVSSVLPQSFQAP